MENKTKKERIKYFLEGVLCLFVVLLAFPVGIIFGQMIETGFSLPYALSFVFGSGIALLYFTTSDYFEDRLLNKDYYDNMKELFTEEVEVDEEEVLTKSNKETNEYKIDYDQAIINQAVLVSMKCNYIENNEDRIKVLNYVRNLVGNYEVNKDSLDEIERLKQVKRILSDTSIILHRLNEISDKREDEIITSTVDNELKRVKKI